MGVYRKGLADGRIYFILGRNGKEHHVDKEGINN